jgi:hypothetical protein
MKQLCSRGIAFVLLLLTQTISAGEGKLLATAGLTQVEGSGGGGIVPWATLAGYDSDEELSAAAYSTQVNLDDYRLNAWGVSAGIYDRVEISVAQQTFDLTSLGGDINQNIFGVKARLYGDVVYSLWPQTSIGLQYKTLQDPDVAKLVGAKSDDSGTDFYLAMTKVHLGVMAGYNLVWNLTARATKANQLGLLGYGGINNNSYELMLEGSLGVFLSRQLAIGVEYRQKPDNLSVKEEDWKDIFITYLPNKHVNFTAAWADLGDIAGAKDQQGLYLSMTGYLW